jgi:hypothetical protein
MALTVSHNDNYKKTANSLSKNLSAHDRAHDLYALMSGAIFESVHERFTEKKSGSAITFTRSNDQHLYYQHIFILYSKLFSKLNFFSSFSRYSNLNDKLKLKTTSIRYK